MALFDPTRPRDRLPAMQKGFYVTDERRLYRVLEAESGHVLLENARTPDENPVWVSQQALVAGRMRLVRPA
jgi:hypothetical protein